MEVIGSKLVRNAKHFIKSPAIVGSLSKGVATRIPSLKPYSTTVNAHVTPTMPPSASPIHICSFSSISGVENVAEFVPQPTKRMATQGKRHNIRMNPSGLKSKKDNVLNAILAKNAQPEAIQSMVIELLSLPYELDIREFTKVIQACPTLQLSSLVLQEVKRRGLNMDSMMYNVFLKKCEAFKDKDTAFETYKTMVNESIVPDRHTMSILIRSCLAADVPSEAEDLLKKMVTHGIDLNSYVFNIVIDYYARKALPLEAFRMRQNMTEYSIRPDEYTISSLMAACFPVAPSKTYLQILLEDLENGPLPARTVCTNALFSGIAKAPHLENHYKLKIAVNFHSELSKRNYGVGQHAYTSLMSCCAKIGDVEQAKKFLTAMKASNVEPNQYILTAFIATCSKAKDYEDALIMFNYMRSFSKETYRNMRPNRYTYEALILAAGNAGKLEDAFNIFSDMMEDGIESDISSYAKLILACGLCGNLERGLNCIEIVNRSNLKKSSFFYHSMIDLYSRCGKLQEAVAILDEVRHLNDISTSHYHYEPIVKLLAERNDWTEVDKFLDNWGDVSYSTYLYLIMDSYKRGLYDKVVTYTDRMEKQGQYPYSSLLPIIEDAKKHTTELHPSDPSIKWSDLDFDLDFDLDVNSSMF